MLAKEKQQCVTCRVFTRIYRQIKNCPTSITLQLLEREKRNTGKYFPSSQVLTEVDWRTFIFISSKKDHNRNRISSEKAPTSRCSEGIGC